MKIQPLTLADLPDIDDLQPEGWPSILPHIQVYLSSPFCLPLKVCVDSTTVGIGTTIYHGDVAWLAHIIVHPDYRNQGIGKLINRTLVDQIKSSPCKTIYLIATDLGAPVYSKVGFETEIEYLFFKDLELSTPQELSEFVVPYSPQLKSQIFAMDRLTTGEDRTAHIESHLAGSFAYVQEEKVQGYYLPGFGEGTIIARCPHAGLELIKLRLKTSKNASFPIENLTATDFLNNLGFKEFKRAKRMRLGEKRDWLPKNLYNRTGGNIG